jgi:cytochrome c oxidase subunit 2
MKGLYIYSLFKQSPCFLVETATFKVISMRFFKLSPFMIGFLSLLACLGGVFLLNGTANAAQPEAWRLNLQDAASITAEATHQFHNKLLVIIFVISLFVLALLVFVMWRFRADKNPVPSKTTHNVMLEVIWTVIPIIILIIIVIPSMRLLFLSDKTADADLTLKVTGHQWYWSYEYPDHGGVSFDSYMIEDKDLKEGQVRLLSTDNPVVLPVDTNIRIHVTAADVLHSWAIPAFSVKKDAIPGRLNETWVRITKPGTYFGQCSELCGTRHGFMPIEIKAVSKEEFDAWVKSKGGTLPEEEAAKAAAEAELKKAEEAAAAGALGADASETSAAGEATTAVTAEENKDAGAAGAVKPAEGAGAVGDVKTEATTGATTGAPASSEAKPVTQSAPATTEPAKQPATDAATPNTNDTTP